MAMQTGSEHLKAQQAIMQAKNFYNGKIDGIWGPKTIAAKKKWEGSGKYSPAIPNNGLPLDDRGPLPAGVMRQADGTLTCVELMRKKDAQKQPEPQVKPAEPKPAEAPVAQEAVPAIVIKNDKK